MIFCFTGDVDIGCVFVYGDAGAAFVFAPGEIYGEWLAVACGGEGVGGEPGFGDVVADFEMGVGGGCEVDSEFVLCPPVGFEFYAVDAVS